MFYYTFKSMEESGLLDVTNSSLSDEINSLEDSSAFAIDIFQRALEFLENLLSNHSSQWILTKAT